MTKKRDYYYRKIKRPEAIIRMCCYVEVEGFIKDIHGKKVRYTRIPFSVDLTDSEFLEAADTLNDYYKLKVDLARKAMKLARKALDKEKRKRDSLSTGLR